MGTVKSALGDKLFGDEPKPNPREAIGGNNPPTTKELVTAKLAADYVGLLADVDALATKANALPSELKTDADLAGYPEVVKDARALHRDLDKKRAEEGEEPLRTTQAINEFFRAPIDRLARIFATLERRAGAYEHAKAEAQRKAAAEEAARIRAAEDEKRKAAIAEDERNRKKSARAKVAEADALAGLAAHQEAQAAAPVEKVQSDVAGVSTDVEWVADISDLDAMDLNQLKPHFARADLDKALRAFVKLHKGTKPLAGVTLRQQPKARFK